MSSPSGADQVFVLRPDLPLRGLAISAAAVLVGVVLLVASSEFDWPVALGWVGLALGVLGVAIGVAAWVSARRMRSEITVRPGGLTIAGVRGRTTLPWTEIERVTAVGDQLVLTRTTDRTELMIINPRGAREPSYLPLAQAIRDRMDDDRGYRQL